MNQARQEEDRRLEQVAAQVDAHAMSYQISDQISDKERAERELKKLHELEVYLKQLQEGKQLALKTRLKGKAVASVQPVSEEQSVSQQSMQAWTPEGP